jgi:CheY-like chemotaxis protein
MARLRNEAEEGAFDPELARLFAAALGEETPVAVTTRHLGKRAAPRPRVLCVDDNRMNRDLVTMTLGDAGFDVAVAENGAEALEVLGREPIDVVLLDLIMPLQGGAETLRLIRADPRHEFLPVIVLTTHRGGTIRSEAIVAGADAIVDCSDSFETRYLVNDACCAQGVPLVSGAVLGFAGQVMTIDPGRSACYRCAFETPPPAGSVPSCREAGVLGATAGIVGSIQALEAIKLVAGVGRPLLDRILHVDALAMEQTLVATERRDGCSACARVPAAASSG